MTTSPRSRSTAASTLAAGLVARAERARRDRAELSARLEAPREIADLRAALADERARVDALAEELERRERAADAEADAIRDRLRATVDRSAAALGRQRFDRAMAVGRELGLVDDGTTALEREEALPAMKAAIARKRAEVIASLRRAGAAIAAAGPGAATVAPTAARVELAWTAISKLTRTARAPAGAAPLRESVDALAPRPLRRLVRSVLPQLAADAVAERELGLTGQDPLAEVVACEDGRGPRS